MNQDILIVISVLALATFLVGNSRTQDAIQGLVPVQSKVDYKLYFVQDKDDKQQAADNLAIIRRRCEDLVQHMSTKYPTNPDVLQLKKNFNPNNFVEAGKNKKYTSYSINKGEKIVLCLRNKQSANEDLVQLNTVMYVTIHELSHLMTKSVGHKEEFWANFKLLLEEAVNIQIYQKVDYEKSPEKYCGIEISSSVLN
jgi:hypothetical protein